MYILVLVLYYCLFVVYYCFFCSCISIGTTVFFVVSYPVASYGVCQPCPSEGKRGTKGVRLDRLRFMS